jgi:hypothetical protein
MQGSINDLLESVPSDDLPPLDGLDLEDRTASGCLPLPDPQRDIPYQVRRHGLKLKTIHGPAIALGGLAVEAERPGRFPRAEHQQRGLLEQFRGAQDKRVA